MVFIGSHVECRTHTYNYICTHAKKGHTRKIGRQSTCVLLTLVVSAPGTLGPGEESVISASGTLGTADDSVVSASGTLGTSDEAVLSAHQIRLGLANTQSVQLLVPLR